METNSISAVMKEMMVLHKNSIEIYNKLVEALTTNNEFITAEITDFTDGNIKKITIPSFNSFKTDLTRIDNNVINMAGIGEAISNVKLSDGTWRKVITSSVAKEANPIVEMQTPNNFEYRNNWFFENFLNPLIYVTFDLTNKVPITTKKVIARKVLLNLDSSDKISYYNINYNKRSDIDHDAFIKDMTKNSIEYYLDDDILDLPVRENVVYGNFSIIKIFTDESEEIIDGVAIKKYQKKYLFDKLTYSSRLSSLKETERLKVNDSVLVNKNGKNSRYKITSIDNSTNFVTLEQVEGFDSIDLGTDILSIYSAQSNNIEAQIPIGFDQTTVIFLRPIDNDFNIAAMFWSPGSAFYTNELTLNLPDRTSVNLETFYKNEVTDFGVFLMGLAKDGSTPSILGIKPEAPALAIESFKVVEVNQHVTKQEKIEELKKLQAEKNRIQSELKETETSINEKRLSVSTKKYRSSVERENDLNDLNNLEIEHDRISNLYSSTVEKINNISKTISKNIDPKYKVRGFIPFPIAKTSTNTQPQEIVQFLIEYRYLSKAGTSNKAEEISYKDNDGQIVKGSFSPWISIKSDVRKRELDPTTGQYIWKVEDVENPDSTNINTVDITINKDEIVEIRVKSISEAGYSTGNPLESDWSSTIQIPFPDNLDVSSDSADIINQSEQEIVKISVMQDLKAKGIDKHISDSFSSNGKYYTHNAINLASGFLTTEQAPISIYDKFIELENKFKALEESIQQAKGKLQVRLSDEDGNYYNLVPYKNTFVFAGYYEDLVASLPVKKGAIVNKTYFLTIENTAASFLELISKKPGNKTLNIVDVTNDFPAYHLAPIINTNTSSYLTSKQNKAQILYFRGVGLENDLDYLVLNSSATGTDFNNQATGISSIHTNATAGVGSGGFIYINQTTNDGSTLGATDLAIHQDHPDAINSIANSIILTFNDYLNSNLASLTDGVSYGKYQWSYGTTSKLSFVPNDQFLLGSKSVGSYCYPIIDNSSDDYFVDGVGNLAKRKIEIGLEKSIRIPIVFQFRMTDYWGFGNTGIGNIGGDVNGAITNLSYTKRVGFDIKTFNGDEFNFDIEFNAKYKSEGATIKNVPRIANIPLSNN